MENKEAPDLDSKKVTKIITFIVTNWKFFAWIFPMLITGATFSYNFVHRMSALESDYPVLQRKVSQQNREIDSLKVLVIDSKAEIKSFEDKVDSISIKADNHDRKKRK